MSALPCMSAPGLPPAEGWLPVDTIAFVTTESPSHLGAGTQPSGRQTASPTNQIPKTVAGQLIADSGIASLLATLQNDADVPILNLLSIASGQCTLGVARNGWTPQSTNRLAFLALVDGGERAGGLRRWLADVRSNWTAQGVTTTTRTILGHDCLAVELSSQRLIGRALASLDPLAPGAAQNRQPGAPSAPESPLPPTSDLRLVLGQVSSFLVAATEEQLFESVLSRLLGEDSPSIRTNTDFLRACDRGLRGADIRVWIDLRPGLEYLGFLAAEADKNSSETNSAVPLPKWSTLLSISGLPGLRSAWLTLKQSPEGALVEARVENPAAHRHGLLKMIDFQALDASPPGFVPAEVDRFERLRLDLRQVWGVFEESLTNVFSQASGVMRFLFQTAAGGGEEGVDLKAELLSSLGNDLIRWEARATSDAAASTPSATGFYLVGSPRPERFLQVLDSLSILLPPPLDRHVVRDIAGQKVYTLELPGKETDSSNSAPRQLHLGVSGDYLLATSDIDRLPGLVTNQAAAPRSLAREPAVARATARIGGWGQGFFGYFRIDPEHPDLSPAADETDDLPRPTAPGPPPLGVGETQTDSTNTVDPPGIARAGSIPRTPAFGVCTARTQEDGWVIRWFLPSELERLQPPPPLAPAEPSTTNAPSTGAQPAGAAWTNAPPDGADPAKTAPIEAPTVEPPATNRTASGR